MVAEVAVGAAVLYVAMCGLLFFGQSKQRMIADAAVGGGAFFTRTGEGR
jgi:hypothetical protein